MLRRDDDTDGEDAGGEAVVHVLAGVAPTLWRHASGASMETLRASAVGLHGTPPSDDAATLVASAVRELEEAGLLQRGASVDLRNSDGTTALVEAWAARERTREASSRCGCAFASVTPPWVAHRV